MISFKNILTVMLGSGIGGALRFISSEYIKQYLPTRFPFGTFFVNLLGCFIIGIVYGLSIKGNQDSNGLKYRVKLPDTTFARDLRQLIKDGIIHQSSFAFTVKEQRWTKPDKSGEPHVRTITKVNRLYDVSPVTTPAYPDASVGARSFTELVKDDQPLTADLIDFKIKINKHK
jgi:HK97 family phage prohead protease